MDGTLCEMVESTRAYASGWEDCPIPRIINELRSMKNAGHTIIILTGRKYSYHEETKQWLSYHDIPYDHLIMNMDGQPEENHIFKKKVLRVLIQMYQIMMLYDDNPAVENVCKKLKIPFYPCY